MDVYLRNFFLLLILPLLLIATLPNSTSGATIELQLPKTIVEHRPKDYLRLTYDPKKGRPASGYTFRAIDAINSQGAIVINDAEPGEEYKFVLYRIDGGGTTGAKPVAVEEFTARHNTEPDPPRNLAIEVRSGKEVHLTWQAPPMGHVSSYKVTILPINEPEGRVREFDVPATEVGLTLHDLTPGATYEIHLSSVFLDKTSTVFLSTNFTTKPAAPGRFIVWFRNETALLVLWQPPYPSGVFDKYRVAITPEDAAQSVLEVEKESDPPGPAQAEFYGLLPGREYNISVQTVSADQVSQPTEASYRTVPLPPANVTFDKSTVGSFSFDVEWEPPSSPTEYDRYQVSLDKDKDKSSSIPKVVLKDEVRRVHFDEELTPGQTYKALVKTISGNVASWNISVNCTTQPLPITQLKAKAGRLNNLIHVEWTPNNKSIQDSYMIGYYDVDSFTGSDGSVQVVHENKMDLTGLLAGRNYSIAVRAISKDVKSDPVYAWQTTRPASPVIGVIEIVPNYALNVSWKSDVTSRQDEFQVVWVRNDTRKKEERSTKDNWMLLSNLYPGAGYEILVSAVSYGLKSPPHSYFQTVPPRPVEGLHQRLPPSAGPGVIGNGTNAVVMIEWLKPVESLVDSYMVKYRPVDQSFWRDLPAVNTTECSLEELESGQRYVIRVSSTSNKVESDSRDIREIEVTTKPQPVKNINYRADATNITFEWRAPYGRIDYYVIEYYPSNDISKSKQTLQISANQSRPGMLVTAVVDSLRSGELYQFNWVTISFGESSPKYGLSVRTMPSLDSFVTLINEQGRHSIGIKYSPTSTRHITFDLYRFRISDPSGFSYEIDKQKDDPERLVEFSNLAAGRLYNITMWTVSGGVLSMPLSRQLRLSPEPISTVRADSVSDTEITLTLERPSGDCDAYEIKYFDPVVSQLITNVTLVTGMGPDRITYRGLKPHHNYTFEMTTLSGYGTSLMSRSSLHSQTFATLESIPGKVSNFMAKETKPYQVTLQWSLPERDKNGVLTGYKITYYNKGSSTNWKHQTFPSEDNTGVIYGLAPDVTYVFIIQAHTKIGPGHKEQIEVKTPIWPPEQPPDNTYPIEVAHSSATIRIRFRKNFFSNRNGPIIAYTIIVAETHTKPTNTPELPSWWDVHDLDQWPPYQAVDPYYPFNNTLIEDFIVGSEDCTSTGRTVIQSKYCNGPLRPGASYRVKLRAFTTKDLFTDTVWSYAVTTDPDNTAILVGLAIPMSLLVLLAVTLFILKHQQKGPFKQRGIGSGPGGLGGSDLGPNFFIGREPVFNMEPIPTTRPVAVKDFARHYRIMSADSDFRFAEEFEKLERVGKDKPCTAADLVVNRPKNRFTNILPYDHSRVKLIPTDDDEGSDYINANYIPGHNGPREFIVTQGPLHSTRDDLWRMVWEQNCRAVVMLTRCVEKGREKCDHYWPEDLEPVMYGDIQVTIMNERTYPDWKISEFRVARGGESRVVRHFHFTTWPDFGVPEPPTVLVKFVRAFRDLVRPSVASKHPIVVHCSAGVGRSGTFVALDRILQDIMHQDTVDIYGIVHEMRRERCYMVQNEQQYICIHQCLLSVLQGEHDDGMYQPQHHENEAFDDDEGISENTI